MTALHAPSRAAERRALLLAIGTRALFLGA